MRPICLCRTCRGRDAPPVFPDFRRAASAAAGSIRALRRTKHPRIDNCWGPQALLLPTSLRCVLGSEPLPRSAPTAAAPVAAHFTCGERRVSDDPCHRGRQSPSPLIPDRKSNYLFDACLRKTALALAVQNKQIVEAVHGQAMTLNKMRLRRWMYRRSIN